MMKVVRVKVPMVRPMVRCSFKRVLRTMPSVVLLVFVVGLIFLTLMQIAVIHANRRALYAQREPLPGSATVVSSSKPSTTNPPKTTHTNAPKQTQPPAQNVNMKVPEVVRVEAFVDKNAPTVEGNLIALRTEVHIGRIRELLREVLGELAHLRNQTKGHKKIRIPPAMSLDKERRLPNVEVKQLCPAVPPHLEGRVKVDLSGHVTWTDVINREVAPGGEWRPTSCRARHRMALIIPYRDREEHLYILLSHLYPILMKQQMHFKVYVVEQFGNETFNKGVLMNAGVREALKEHDFHCFVFHDVDMIPEDDRNMYTCPHNPRHLSVAVDKFNYSLPYAMLVGGVFSIKTEHFATVNGYSNLYWGWGGEDDDIAYRIKFRKLPIVRPPESLARYSMIKHDHRAESPNNVRSALLRMSKRRSARDGLNSVKYRLVNKTDHAHFTHLMIDIGHNHRWKFVQGKKLIISF